MRRERGKERREGGERGDEDWKEQSEGNRGEEEGMVWVEERSEKERRKVECEQQISHKHTVQAHRTDTHTHKKQFPQCPCKCHNTATAA